MDKYQELVTYLSYQRVSPLRFVVNGKPLENSYCLNTEDGQIKAYYFRQGKKIIFRRFTDEDLAIAYFKKWVLADTNALLPQKRGVLGSAAKKIKHTKNKLASAASQSGFPSSIRLPALQISPLSVKIVDQSKSS